MPKTRITPDWVKAFRKAIKQTCTIGWSVINDRGRVRLQVGKRSDNGEIVIKIEINDKVYPVSCKLGEEERVKNSAKLVLIIRSVPLSLISGKPLSHLM